MIRNLCKIGLAVASRQNEMIELALTNGYRSIEIDMDDMLGRAESFGNEFACQFVNSCNVGVGIFQLPIDFSAPDDRYAKMVARLPLLLEICEAIGAKRSYSVITPGSDDLPYHENFEKQRGRITDIAQQLAAKDIQIGLAIDAIKSHRENKAHQFIANPEDVLAFMEAIGQPNVGVAIDTFHWTLAGGSMDQIEQLGISSVVDVRLSDFPSEKDPAKIVNSDRQLPSNDPTSICQSLFNWLEQKDYQGPVAACASSSQIRVDDPQAIVEQFKKSLDRLAGIEIPVAESESKPETSETPDADTKADAGTESDQTPQSVGSNS